LRLIDAAQRAVKRIVEEQSVPEGVGALYDRTHAKAIKTLMITSVMKENKTKIKFGKKLNCRHKNKISNKLNRRHVLFAVASNLWIPRTSPQKLAKVVHTYTFRFALP
jgi:hypothetical protein